jgi:toxin ParE1/3/4
MRVNWSPRANRDLHELISYIAEESIQGAELVADRILKVAELLTQMPRSGRSGRALGTRERVVGRTPYILAYRIVSRRVRILRNYHGARKWPRNF